MKPCLRCGQPSETSRCRDCRPRDTRPRDRATRTNRAAWKNLSRRLRRMQPWCTTCGAVNDLTVDHIVPLEDGGDAYDLANLQILCRACNTSAWHRRRGEEPRPGGSSDSRQAADTNENRSQ